MYQPARKIKVTTGHAASKAHVEETFDYAAVLNRMHAVDAADHKDKGSWSRVARVIGFGDKSLWCRASKGGPLSRKAENRLRQMLGIAPKGQPNLDYWTPRTVRRYMAGRRPYQA